MFICLFICCVEKELREALERELVDARADRSRLKALLEAEHVKFIQLQQKVDSGKQNSSE
jgi:hypothetical protein